MSVMVLELAQSDAKGDGGIFLLDTMSENRSYKTNGVLESDPQKHPIDSIRSDFIAPSFHYSICLHITALRVFLLLS